MKLTLDKCKEICTDFRYVAGNKPPCLFAKEEMCALPRHFVCELVLFKRKLARKEQIQATALSVSRLGTAERCPRAYAFNYEFHLEQEEPAAWKRMGDAFGVGRARLDTNLSLDLDALRKDLLPYERAKVRAALRLYRLCIGNAASPLRYQPGEVTCEHEVLFQHQGTWFLGFIDALSLSKQHVFEWKFAITDYEHLDIARQAAVYMKGVPGAQEFTLSCFRKPGQRPHKLETPLAFEGRIYTEMCAKPEEWIKHFTLSRDQLNVDAVLDQMVESWQSVKPSAPWTPHLSSCRDCDWRTVCERQIGATTEVIAHGIKGTDGCP